MKNIFHSPFHIPNSALRRLVALVVAELFVCSSILPAWASASLQTDLSPLRPVSARDGGGTVKKLRQELNPTQAKDGGATLPSGTRIRHPAHPNVEFEVRHDTELADGKTISFKDNPAGTKGYRVMERTKVDLEVFWKGQWVKLGDFMRDLQHEEKPKPELTRDRPRKGEDHFEREKTASRGITDVMVDQLKDRMSTSGFGFVHELPVSFIKSHWGELIDFEAEAEGEEEDEEDEFSITSMKLDAWQGLPELIRAFGLEWVDAHWRDLNEIARYIPSDDVSHNEFWIFLINLKAELGIEQINAHWPFLIQVIRRDWDDVWQVLVEVHREIIRQEPDDIERTIYEPILGLLQKLITFQGGDDRLATTSGEISLTDTELYEVLADLVYLQARIVPYWQDLKELGAVGENRVGFLKAFIALNKIFGDRWIDTHWPKLKQHFETIRDRTTDYNRASVVDLLFSSENILWLAGNKIDLFSHLEFYETVLSTERRLGYQILDGILEGLKTGIINPQLTSSEQEKILRFVSRFHTFDPTLFSLYKAGDEEALRPLFALAEKFILDEVGKEEIERFVAHYDGRGLNGLQILAATVQIALPASGASFVGREDVAELLGSFIQQGDLRDHVPSSLRNRDFGEGEKDAFRLVARALREGESFDPEKRIGRLLSNLRYKDRGLPDEVKASRAQQDQEKLEKALLHYFTTRSSQDKIAVLDAFYRYASHNDQLGEKVDRIQPEDYQGIDLLEQLFIDKDNLTVLLREVLKEINPDRFPQAAVEIKTINNPRAMAAQIEGISRSNRRPREKQTLIARVLQDISQEEVQSKLLPRLEDQTLRGLVQEISQRPRETRPLTQAEIVSELFEEPVKMIQAEKDKFEPKELDRKIVLQFKVVKGIPYGLWGINCGVCIASDLELWKNPNFFLLAMIDKSAKKVVGFAHLFQQEIEGKKVLTVPGIEPTVELFSEVKPREVYPLIEKALIRIAKEGNYDQLAFPTDPSVLSNRPDIQKEVKRRYASKVKTLPFEVQWNHLPTPYPFGEVYVIWKKKAADGGRQIADRFAKEKLPQATPLRGRIPAKLLVPAQSP